MPPPYTFRPVTDADYEWLLRLGERTMRAYAEQTYGPWDEALVRRLFAERWRPAHSRIVVVDGQDVGRLELLPTERGVEVGSIAVVPEYQGRGLGTALLAEVLRDARRDRRVVTLRVLKVNPARRLYERLGFVVTGETATHFLMTADPAAGPPDPPAGA